MKNVRDITLDSALPHLWKLKKSMGEKYRFQLFLCTKIMIKNSKFSILTMLHDSTIFFSYALFNYQWLVSRAMQSLIIFLYWSPAECEPQGDNYCEQNPKCYHRTIKSSSSIESWSTDDHSFNNDLLLRNGCCLNGLNCILTSVWPNPYFDIFHHQKNEWERFLKIFKLFLTVRVLPWLVFVFYQAIYID